MLEPQFCSRQFTGPTGVIPRGFGFRIREEGQEPCDTGAIGDLLYDRRETRPVTRDTVRPAQATRGKSRPNDSQSHSRESWTDQSLRRVVGKSPDALPPRRLTLPDKTASRWSRLP